MNFPKINYINYTCDVPSSKSTFFIKKDVTEKTGFKILLKLFISLPYTRYLLRLSDLTCNTFVSVSPI